MPPVTTHLAGPYAQEVTLKNLRKFTRYEITVRVYNSYGDGPKSRAVSFSTPADSKLVLSLIRYTLLQYLNFKFQIESRIFPAVFT